MTDQKTTTTVTANLIKADEKKLVIKTGEIFKVATPDGLVSDTGVMELETYLCCAGLGRLPEDFEPLWVTRRGTLPKRIQAHAYKALGVKLTTEQISEIGNIAKRNTSTAQTYVCDFTNSIDWHAGEFGDGGSCYWGDKSGAKQMIEENGYAIRLYKERVSGGGEGRTNLRGYARAWIAPIAGNRLILFNGYGETSLAIARILSVHFACQYKKITLENNGSDGGTLWINGGASFILGSWEGIKDVERYDLQWEDCDGESTVACVVCDSDLDDDDCTHAYDRHGDVQPCCDGCCFACHRCDETYVEVMERTHNGDSYCPNCLSEVEREEEQARERKQEEIERKEREVSCLKDESARLEDEIQDKQDRVAEIGEEIGELESVISDLKSELEDC